MCVCVCRARITANERTNKIHNIHYDLCICTKQKSEKKHIYIYNNRLNFCRAFSLLLLAVVRCCCLFQPSSDYIIYVLNIFFFRFAFSLFVCVVVVVVRTEMTFKCLENIFVDYIFLLVYYYYYFPHKRNSHTHTRALLPVNTYLDLH